MNDEVENVVGGDNLYKKLFEESADATLIIKGNMFIDCNKATLSMFRMDSKQQVFNTHPSILSPIKQPDNRASLEKSEEMIAIAFRDGSNRFEWVHKRIDGTLFDAEVLLIRISHNKHTFLHCVLRDITKRIEARSALRSSEENYKFLFDQAVDGIIVGNEKGVIIDANLGMSKITGYSYDELVGQSVKILFPDKVLKSQIPKNIQI